MKEPKSKLPWSIKGLENSSTGDNEEDKYQIDYYNEEKDYTFTIIHNDSYYNQAPNKQDAEYIVEAANNYPEAVSLLKHVVEYAKEGYQKGILSDAEIVMYIQQLNIDEFLEKIEDGSKGE